MNDIQKNEYIFSQYYKKRKQYYNLSIRTLLFRNRAIDCKVEMS